MAEYPLALSLVPGVEALSPAPLPRGERFTVTIEGTFVYGEPRVRADALYGADGLGNFSFRHGAYVYFDREPWTKYATHLDELESQDEAALRARGVGPVLDRLRREKREGPWVALLEENRARHRYTFLYYGMGRELGLRVEDPARAFKASLSRELRPLGSSRRGDAPPAPPPPAEGTLTVTIAPFEGVYGDQAARDQAATPTEQYAKDLEEEAIILLGKSQANAELEKKLIEQGATPDQARALIQEAIRNQRRRGLRL